MSNLTRIKNNQITDSTIWANAKIIPGSIVGSLFSSNIVVTSDFVITGNLYVAGASTYLTVASTNTFVNDPLIVLNNAYSAGGIYDIGFIFERGTDDNQAFYWDETSDEFKLIATSEAGSTYGNIGAEISYSNFRLGNLYLNNYVAGRALFIGSSGLITTEADYTYNSTDNVLKVGNFQFRGNTSTIATTGADESILLLPSGTGIIDASGFNLGNLAAPVSGDDAVTLTYLNSQISSAVTNIQDDDTEVRITDDGVNAGQINANVDATSALVIKSNSISILGSGYTGSSPKVFIDGANSNVAIASKLFVTDVTTLNSRAIISSTVPASSYTTGAVTVEGGVGIGGNLYVGAGIQNTIIGNITAAAGFFTTLSASQNFYANASIATTTQGTGAIVVPNGGISVSGAANIAGAITTAGAAQFNNTVTIGGITTLTDATNSSDATGTTGALRISGGGSIAKDLWIGGNLYVANVFGVSVQQISVQDPLLYLTASNLYPYTYDIGIFSQFIGGAGNIYQHTGFVRDASDAYWKLFSNSVSEPTATITFDGTEIYDGLKIGNLVLTDTSTAISAVGFINTTANISGAVVNTGALNVTGTTTLAAINSTGFINTTANISAAIGNFGAVNSTGFINTTGNISGAVINGGAINSTGLINTTGNVVAAEVSTGTLNATGFVNTAGNVSAASVIAGQFNTTGNLVASQVSTGTLNATGLINTLGNISASRINADTLAATGTVYANATTDTSSLTTGALIVAGGAAVGKTMWVGEGARINSTQSAESFHVLGQGTDNSLIYADFAKNALVFGGANTAVQDGAVAKFNSPGAIVLPVGSNAQRPGAAGNVDVAGMIRFNSTSNALEYYDGSQWSVAGSEFTVITTNSFSGNGAQYDFTLSSASTTAGTLVMVNGVVQIPTTAYSVTGTTLTFTEAPATGDAIDARVLITTATVSAISSGNGFNNFDVATAPYANVTAGTSAATVRVSVDGVTGRVTFTNDVTINGSLTVLGDSNGNINIGNETGDRLQLRGKTVYDQTAINVPDTNLSLLDSFSTSAFTTAKYTVQVKNGGSVSAAELLVSHDTATSNIATYAVLSTIPGTFQSNISSGTVRLFYTPSGVQNANIKLLTTYIV